MNRQFTFAPEEFYHLYNRGVDKRTIFLDHNDHWRFLTLLLLSNTTTPTHTQNEFRLKQSPFEKNTEANALIDIIAYCLMPNHFHILAKEKMDGGMSKFMQKLCTAYSMYFNKKHERSGTLFQGKFKATHVDNDRYLRYLTAYIHLNPVKLIDPKWKENGIKNRAAAKKYLKNYRYSSYPDYTEDTERDLGKILNKKAHPHYQETTYTFEQEVDDWLTLRPDFI